MDITFGRKSKTANLLPPVFSIYGPFDDFSDPMFPVKLILQIFNSYIYITYFMCH